MHSNSFGWHWSARPPPSGWQFLISRNRRRVRIVAPAALRYIAMMDRQQAIEMIRGSPLAEFAELLIGQMLPSARLIVAEDGGEEAGARASHFGGLPILPRSFEWPRWDRDVLLRSEISRLDEKFQKNPRATGLRDIAAQKREQLGQGPLPLAFLCQLFLRDLHGAVPLRDWPSDGSLAFFYDPAQSWGFDPAARGHSRVVYVPEDEELVPVAAPAGLADGKFAALFPERRLRFTPEWTLPTRLDAGGEDLSIWGSEDYAALLQQLMSVSDEREPVHRCGGHPQEVQGDMRLECQLVTNGLYCGDATGYEDPRAAALEEGAADWQLLLQIDSDESRLGWMWGDVGRLYFWIRRQDLAAKDFDGVWVVLQCY